MSESADTQITSLEDLLRGLATLPPVQRRPVEAPHAAPQCGCRPILAAAVALMIFVPGGAASAIFLLQSDDAIAFPAQAPMSEPLLTKSDRLPPFVSALQPAHSFDPQTLMMGEITPMSSLHMPRHVAVLDPAAIRGSIEDAPTTMMVGSVTARDAMAEMTAPPAPKLKVRRRVARVKAPELVAEIIPEPEPPSLLQRLFGYRSL